jgi:hypothetical protein
VKKNFSIFGKPNKENSLFKGMIGSEQANPFKVFPVKPEEELK